ncbi:ArgS-related anticodon-binding protein NrtL [Streptomyces sp. NPDC047108]|uniref:ArgS-related anticodon-binding protein NrtL n=1 Tax=Streptomyces sp. NPDC047108 TaxID=3155025 RepID=UPI0033DE2C9C
MTPAELSRTVLRTVRRAVEAGELRAPVPARVVVRRPPRPGCGDYATNVALQLAPHAGRPPRQVAEILRARIQETAGVARVEIAEPGFLNITLERGGHSAVVQDVLAAGSFYGHRQGYAYGSEHQDPDQDPDQDISAPAAVELRFAPDIRAALTADALARILRTQGATDVRLLCGGEPDPLWVHALGINTREINAREISALRGAPAASAGRIRPVPAPHPAAELLRTLGPDATRWALLRPAAHDHPRTDPAGLLAQRESNPLFRVQYAHARACASLRNAADLGITPDPSATDPASGDPAHSDAAHRDAAHGDPAAPPVGPTPDGAHPAALLAEYPGVLASAARLRAPDRLARHLEATADAFLRHQAHHPVLPRGDEKPEAAHRARAALAQAAGTVLAGGLHLLGITAPAHL